MKQKINNIQALRAYAAVAVAIFHTGYIPPHAPFAIGSFGVDVFFVISGYIMARICATNADFFLRRRLIRIVPPYWAMTLLLFFVALRYPQLMGATRASGVELLKSLFFIPFYKSSGLLRPLLFVGWSLNYEMFFYLAIWAGLLLYRRRPLLVASGLVLATCALCAAFARHGALPAFYGNPIVIEFVLGIVAYKLAQRNSVTTASRIRYGSLALLLLSLAGIIAIQANHLPRGGWGTAALELLAGLTVLSASLLSQAGWDTNLGWLILIGDASYILYLVHPYCEYFMGRVVLKRIAALDIAHPLGSSIVVLMSILLAILLHLRLERPAVSYLNRRFGGNRKSAEFAGAKAAPSSVAA